jgi:hypothetical protein
MKKVNIPLYTVSAATGEGLPELLEAMWSEVSAARADEQA